jgi:Flp pilus assembly protein TadD
MICPACQAENPAGTRICVKCGHDLPQPVETGAEVFTTDHFADKSAKAKNKFGVRDMARDVVDFCWLLLIIFLVFLGFLGEVTHWTFRFTETEEAQLHVKPAIVKPLKHHVKIVQPKEESENIIAEKPEAVYGNPAVFYKKGKKQFDLHHYQSSFTFLRQALEIDPTYAQAYFGLGYLYARFDMNDAAVRMYEMALRFDPSHIEAMNNLAMMYFHAGNYDDALELIQKAVAMGDSADCEYNLGSIYLEKNQPDSALSAFQKAVSMRPNDAAIYNNMALTDEKLGKKQEAIDSWNKVLQYSDNADLLQQAKTHLDFLQAQS